MKGLLQTEKLKCRSYFERLKNWWIFLRINNSAAINVFSTCVSKRYHLIIKLTNNEIDCVVSVLFSLLKDWRSSMNWFILLLPCWVGVYVSYLTISWYISGGLGDNIFSFLIVPALLYAYLSLLYLFFSL